MLLFVLIPVVWLTVAALVVAICRMAARGDTLPAPEREVAVYSPRRPTTCGTVRSRILISVHSDQLATYR